MPIGTPNSLQSGPDVSRFLRPRALEDAAGTLVLERPAAPLFSSIPSVASADGDYPESSSWPRPKVQEGTAPGFFDEEPAQAHGPVRLRLGIHTDARRARRSRDGDADHDVATALVHPTTGVSLPSGIDIPSTGPLVLTNSMAIWPDADAVLVLGAQTQQRVAARFEFVDEKDDGDGIPRAVLLVHNMSRIRRFQKDLVSDGDVCFI